MRCSLLIAAGALGRVLAHGDHSKRDSQKPMVDNKADWMTKHMAGMSRDYVMPY